MTSVYGLVCALPRLRALKLSKPRCMYLPPQRPLAALSLPALPAAWPRLGLTKLWNSLASGDQPAVSTAEHTLLERGMLVDLDGRSQGPRWIFVKRR